MMKNLFSLMDSPTELAIAGVEANLVRSRCPIDPTPASVKHSGLEYVTPKGTLRTHHMEVSF